MSNNTLKSRTANICTVHEVFVDWFQLQAPCRKYSQASLRQKRMSLHGGAIFGEGAKQYWGVSYALVSCVVPRRQALGPGARREARPGQTLTCPRHVRVPGPGTINLLQDLARALYDLHTVACRWTFYFSRVLNTVWPTLAVYSRTHYRYRIAVTAA